MPFPEPTLWHLFCPPPSQITILEPIPMTSYIFYLFLLPNYASPIRALSSVVCFKLHKTGKHNIFIFWDTFCCTWYYASEWVISVFFICKKLFRVSCLKLYRFIYFALFKLVGRKYVYFLKNPLTEYTCLSGLHSSALFLGCKMPFPPKL